ncbi:MAG: ATPase [Candidatus Melainabacteria bacterium RIFCSPLOWO2_02_FULL_35_15]|nr:MAG: ATPase [Candidatus Melainabacteria bacterium RIFCSPLOWO2_12_FULL_35_11]OGI13465.1 MAG: ATPase [Candidatus Melainabacteria bacterium RIFCSPLOWO2_02_FULL_35_15]
MFNRLIDNLLKEKNSFFLFGARGTGKTFWLREKLPRESILIDLLESDNYIKLQNRPQHLEEIIPPDYNGWVIIDEVQKIPELLNEVHRLIELKKYRFILTGSSARSLRKKGVNLLGGRALNYKLYPLTAKELGDEWDINTALKYGTLPSIYSRHKNQPKKYLESYIETYLKEEVLQEGLTRNLGAFSRFMEIASFSQGSVLNMTEIARESQINRKIVEGYFSLLEDLLIAYRLPIFTKKAKRKLITHPKFYYFDVGIYRILRQLGPMDFDPEISGIALETLVLQHLIAINAYYDFNYKIYYWRTKHGLEIDFVLYGENGLFAIEVKSSNQIHSKHIKALRHFKEDYKIAKLYVFYTGKRELHLEGISIIPVDLALRKLEKILG